MARKKKGALVSVEKAKKILRDDEIRGKKPTKKQNGLFGLIAGGGRPTRIVRS